MRKRITKLVLLAAAVVCLAVGPQNTLRAAAGTSSCGSDCGCTVIVHREIKVLAEETVKCTLPEHNSGTCHVRRHLYQDYNVANCSKCGEEKWREKIGGEYWGEEHFDFCR